uniref:Ubiquitin-like domain-containing protein n=1 Tax=Panagrellus redivivus TaxID=6233 RepID=A0A7E4USS7_PANRE
MVFLVLRLVGGKKDRLFHNFDVDTEISRIELLKQIEGQTKIPINHQEVELHGEMLPQHPQPLRSVKEYDEITVKHAGLESWAACLLFFKDMTKTKQDHVKARHAKEGVKHLIDLEKDNFFLAYPSLVAENIVMSAEFDRFVIGVDEYIQMINPLRTGHATHSTGHLTGDAFCTNVLNRSEKRELYSEQRAQPCSDGSRVSIHEHEPAHCPTITVASAQVCPILSCFIIRRRLRVLGALCPGRGR